MESEEKRRIYKEADGMHAYIARNVEKVMTAAFVVILLVPAMLPVSYALYGHPSPQLWTLPVPMQWGP